jgi:hypothetical protein
MKPDATAPRTRFTVDLSDYPDMVAIYLGLRVNSIQGLLPASIMKIKKLHLANVEVVSNPRWQSRQILKGIVRIFTLAATAVALAAHELIAFSQPG